MNKNVRSVAEEAARILKDYPHLKYYEAIMRAKEILKQKYPQDGNPKGAKVNNFRQVYHKGGN